MYSDNTQYKYTSTENNYLEYTGFKVSAPSDFGFLKFNQKYM